MDSLRKELDSLEDNRLAYVMARAMSTSDRQGYLDAGIAKNTYYSWPSEEREKLNNLAQRFKRETVARALMVLQDAAAEAAEVKVSGLKSRDERVKQAAATEIIDRAIGKSEQPVSGELTIHVKVNDRDQYSD